MPSHPRTPKHPRLAAEIAARGWTNRYVAAQVDRHENTISAVIHGVYPPGPALRAALATLFGIDEADLFTEATPRDRWVRAALDGAVEQFGTVEITDPATLDYLADVLSNPGAPVNDRASA